ncbi:MAG: DUF5677 domain-containing protein [Bacteroidales bacterium]
MKIGTYSTFEFLLNKALYLNQKTIGLAVDKYSALCHNFFTKNLLTAISISKLVHPSPNIYLHPVYRTFTFNDPMSALTLVRNMFEAYVNMYYLLINNSTVDEKEFKFLLWERFWRSERQKMAELKNMENDKIVKERNEIEEISNRLIKHEYYNKLNEKQQKYFLYPKNWSNYNMTDRAKMTNIEKNKAEYMYKFLSQYAHSNSFAMMQFGSVENNNGFEKGITDLVMSYTEVILALTIDISKQKFVEIESEINEDQKLKLLINLWKSYYSKPKEKTEHKKNNHNTSQNVKCQSNIKTY